MEEFKMQFSHQNCLGMRRREKLFLLALSFSACLAGGHPSSERDWRRKAYMPDAVIVDLHPRIEVVSGRRRVLLDVELQNESGEDVRLPRGVFVFCSLWEDHLHVTDRNGQPLTYIGSWPENFGAKIDTHTLHVGSAVRVEGMDITDVFDWPSSPQNLALTYEECKECRIPVMTLVAAHLQYDRVDREMREFSAVRDVVRKVGTKNGKTTYYCTRDAAPIRGPDDP